jgi:3-hydroxyisobutyrate dehydrogenase-like beta-hydroxyacid dehydrogenase
VSGGDIGAKNGSLICMIGGDEKKYESILPIL